MENILYTGKKLTARTRMEPARWTLDRETHRTLDRETTLDTFDILEVA